MSYNQAGRPGTPLYNTLDGLSGAIETQGGLKNPGEVRTDAGIYLQYDVAWHLRNSQQEQQDFTTGTFGPLAATAWTSFESVIQNPSVFVGGNVLVQSSADYASTTFVGAAIYARDPNVVGGGVSSAVILAQWNRAAVTNPLDDTAVIEIGGVGQNQPAPVFMLKGALLLPGWTLIGGIRTLGATVGLMEIRATIRHTNGRSEPL